MIIGFVGTPGSGKTYEAVYKILENLKRGRIVYTNIRGLEDAKCRETIKLYCGLTDYGITKLLKHLDDEEIVNFWLHIEPGSLVVVDEAQNFFNSREWQSQKNNEFARWASTHRHHGYDLVLITQAIERIDSAVRSLLEWCYVYRKINFFGSAVQNQYLCYSYNGEDTSGQPLKKERRHYNKFIFLCYKSYVAADVKELNIMQHVNILKHPVFYALPVVFGVFIYMLFFKSSIATGDPFGSKAVVDNFNKAQKQITSTANDPTVKSLVQGEHKPVLKKETVNGVLTFTYK